jgi:hypothetical protein
MSFHSIRAAALIKRKSQRRNARAKVLGLKGFGR